MWARFIQSHMEEVKMRELKSLTKVLNFLILMSGLLFSGCAGSGLMGRGIPIPVPGASTYKINSIPEGAKIYFNGKFIGKTPLEWERWLLFQTFEKTKVEARMIGVML